MSATEPTAVNRCRPTADTKWDRDSGRWFAFVLVACAVVCFNRLHLASGATTS
jgi:hypothetical protein